MRLKGIVALAVIALLAGAVLVVTKLRSGPPVAVTLRFAVTPKEQTDYVAGQANSAKFKYLMGKQSGVKPVLAQKLQVTPVPNSSLLEAHLGVLTQAEANRYAAGFVQTLQWLCGTQAQVTLVQP